MTVEICGSCSHNNFNEMSFILMVVFYDKFYIWLINTIFDVFVLIIDMKRF